METKELRVGNLIQDNDGQVLKVEQLGKDFSYGIDAWGLNREAKHKLPYIPIELTEEWFSKLGAYKTQNQMLGEMIVLELTYDYKISFHKYYEKHHGNNHFSGYRLFEFNAPCVLKYVHQIQNLYFALTGEELPISSVVDSEAELCQCEDSATKHFIKNWCEDCQKNIVR